MITTGCYIFLIAAICKPIFVKTNDGYSIKTIFSYLPIRFKRNGAETALSFLQLLGVLWVGMGGGEMLLGKYMDSIPYVLQSFLEVFLPLMGLLITGYLIKNK